MMMHVASSEKMIDRHVEFREDDCIASMIDRIGDGAASPSKDDGLLLSFIWSAMTMTAPAGPAPPPLGLALRRLMIPSAELPSASSGKTRSLGSSAAPASQPPLCHVCSARRSSSGVSSSHFDRRRLRLPSPKIQAPAGRSSPAVALRPAVGEDLEPVCLSPFCKRVGQADKMLVAFL